MALLERSVTEQRYEAVIQVVRHQVPVTEVAARLGVSRQSARTWIRRYQADGLAGLTDRSRRPTRCPHQVPAEVEATVCQLRKAHPKWGPQRLLHELQRCGVTPLPSRSAIYRLLVRRGLIEPRAARKRRYKRWERDTPMQLWQIDVMGGVFLADGTEVKVVTGVDDHSRLCVLATVVVRATARA
ncbi:MAG: helix-turn-helix domain-containing protein, partial [Pseudonocardiaceae bacterium]